MTLLAIITYSALAATATGIVYLTVSTIKMIITDVKEGY